MRVLYIIDGIAPGGAERSLLAMGPALARHVDLVVAVLHAKPVELRDEFIADGIPVIDILGRSAPGRVLGLRRLITQLRPDLVHTTLFEADVTGRVAAAANGVPVVSSCVGMNYGPLQREAPGVSRSKLAVARRLDAVTARLTSRFHANAEHLVPFVAERLAVSREKIVAIPRGRDPAELGEPSPERRAAARARLGVEDSTHLFVTLARHEYQKGLDLLLDAIEGLPHDRPWRLLVAGRRGNQTGSLEAQLRLSAHAERVELLGVRDDVPELLCAADTLVAPSRWEGFCGAVLEAMGLGVPVAGTAVPGIQEVLGSVPAFLTPLESGADGLGDVLREAMADSARATRARELGRARFLRNFTVGIIAPRLVHELYEPAVGLRS